MAKPIVAALEPKDVQLEKGKEYYFCRCGRSKDQPICDGSHEGTGRAGRLHRARGWRGLVVQVHAVEQFPLL